MLRELVVFLALTSVALAALSLAPLQTKPDKFSIYITLKDDSLDMAVRALEYNIYTNNIKLQENVEGCYIDDLDEVIAIGASAPCKKHCMEYRCRSTNLQIARCGTVASTPGCKLEEDHSKPYPDCCPKPVCK